MKAVHGGPKQDSPHQEEKKFAFKYQTPLDKDQIDVVNDTSLVQAASRAFSCLNDKNMILKFFIYELAAPLPHIHQSPVIEANI